MIFKGKQRKRPHTNHIFLQNIVEFYKIETNWMSNWVYLDHTET